MLTIEKLNNAVDALYAEAAEGKVFSTLDLEKKKLEARAFLVVSIETTLRCILPLDDSPKELARAEASAKRAFP